MAIQYVGGAAHALLGTGSAPAPVTLTNSLSGGIASSPAAGDLVVIWHVNGAFTSGPIGNCGISGYAQESVLYNPSGNTQSTKMGLNWKFMGSTPDTSFQPDSSQNTAYGNAIIVQVWRGVDPTTPFDVAVVQASGNAGSNPDPPSITPATSGAYIIVGGGSANGGTENRTFSSSDLTAFVNVRCDDSSDTNAAAGYVAWTSGAFKPAAWTGAASGSGRTWVAFSAALRPASGSGAQTITGAGFADADTFGAGVISTAYTIQGAGFDEGDAFGGGVVSQTDPPAPPAPDFISGAGLPEEELRRFLDAQQPTQEPQPTDLRKTLEIAAGLREPDAPEGLGEAIEELREAVAPENTGPLLLALEKMRAAEADAEAVARFEQLAARLGAISSRSIDEDDEEVVLLLTVM